MIKGSMAKWFLLKTAITATASPFVSRAASSIGVAAASRQGLSLSPFAPLSSVKRQRNHSTNRGKTSLFESMRTGYYRKTNSDEISLDKLLKKAASVRSRATPIAIEKLNDRNRLFFPSSYDASGSKTNEEMTTRGFSNWIVPGRIMVGQYPGRVPETNTPTEEEVRIHLRNVLFETPSEKPKTQQVCFVSLQSELPPQDDYDSWNKNNGEIYLGDPSSRKEWPNPFSHYAPEVAPVLKGEGNAQQQVSVHYIHHPIQDLSVPFNSKNLKLLLWKLLDFLDSGDATESMVYVHCWGGRGRAGLTACCMLTLLEFAVTSCGEIDGNNITDVQTIFDVVQTGYASRLGSENMPLALSQSPQTESQRDFVKKFYEEVREEANARASRD
jgi:hypothetical protein